jgi:hypothetical protein
MKMSQTLFICNLSVEVIGEEVHDFLNNVVGIHVSRRCINVPRVQDGQKYSGYGKGIAYAICDSPQDANKAVAQSGAHMLLGKPVVIKHSRSTFRYASPKSDAEGDVDFAAYVSTMNVPADVVRTR